MSNSTDNFEYGVNDNSFNAAGGSEGLLKLCKDFYYIMDTIPEASHIRKMHTESLEIMIDKLTLFLTMWLGGPKDFINKYNFIGMPAAHKHLVINEEEESAWLLCMDKAIELQGFNSDFKTYLKKQFRFPAMMIKGAALS